VIEVFIFLCVCDANKDRNLASKGIRTLEYTEGADFNMCAEVVRTKTVLTTAKHNNVLHTLLWPHVWT